MRKKAARTLVAILLATTMTGITVFADDINSANKNVNQALSELDSLKNELSYLLAEMDDIEAKMAEVSTLIDEVTVQLSEAQELQKQQYQDMKLRIKYMYEDQDASIMETLLTSESMSDVLNKAEYMQKVYDYDREKLGEMAVTSKTISDKKAQLLIEQDNIIALQSNLSSKQELLYSTIKEKEGTVADFKSILSAAVETAAKKRNEEEAAVAKKNISVSSVATGDASVGQAVASLAYKYIGTPYRSGGSDPGGFDCSGFTSYLFRQFGITLSRTTGGQIGGGTKVANISQALPGDIICYAGHVGLYVGNGQIVHASVPGDYVKVAPASIMTIIAIRRFW